MILSSTGSAAKEQPSCLGIYRNIGDHNNKPLYKQDDGENYLYYQNKAWLVGPYLGVISDSQPDRISDYAWMKMEGGNSDGASSSESSSSSDSDSDTQEGKETIREKKRKPKAMRKSMGLFREGWKYKPSLMGVDLSEDSDDSAVQWMGDDLTLKVEALKGE